MMSLQRDRTVLILFSFCFFVGHSLYAQFHDFSLGMSMEQVENILFESNLYDYKGEPDVSLLRDPERYLIRCEGRQFIDEILFQFYDDALYIITVDIDGDSFDYYSFYTLLEKKYGESEIFNPGKIVWNEGDNLDIILEKPLRVKYIDKAVFEALAEGVPPASPEELNREAFLDLF